MRIDKFSCTYQRNGSGGQGGFWATFEAPDDDGEMRRFAGHFWHQCRTDFISGNCPEECERELPNEAMVLLIGDLVGMSNGGDAEMVQAWRSTDYFLPSLLPYFNRWHHEWMARVFSPDFADKHYPIPA